MSVPLACDNPTFTCSDELELVTRVGHFVPACICVERPASNICAASTFTLASATKQLPITIAMSTAAPGERDLRIDSLSIALEKLYTQRVHFQHHTEHSFESHF